MIKKISIDNFKLYKKVVVPLKMLNLFTGTNGKGKSSVLQILLLLNQSTKTNRATNRIYLNGENVNLGSFDDIKNKETSFSEHIHFGLEYEDFNVDYYLHHCKPDASELLIEKIASTCNKLEFVLNRENELYIFTADSNSVELKYTLFDLFLSSSNIEQYFKSSNLSVIRANLNLTNVHYVSADRIGPKNYYENRSLGHFISVGALGENTVNVLHHKGNDLINEIVLKGYCEIFNENIEELSRTMEDNTNYWVDKIFQGAKVQVEAIKGEDLLKLRINSDGKSTYFKPTNVGYGFSYSLPIIVAGLIAKPNEILIIENPEAHLHPYAQSIIAKFLSLIASSGVQVIVESHSEHILNGFRVSVKDEIIKQNDVNVLYFDSDKFFRQIEIDEDGGITNWPRNFFDQATNDLNYLLGI